MSIQISRREESDGATVLTLEPGHPGDTPDPGHPGDTPNPGHPSGRAFEVDLLASEDVETALKAAVGEGKSKLVVDLANVTYMHSRAFWAIVRAAEDCNNRGGGLVVVHLSPYMSRLVELTSAAEALQARPEVAEALALLRGETAR